VGTAVGSSVGVCVGSLDGSFVGVCVGANDGSLLVGGRLEHGLKVGVWREFFDTRRRAKLIIQYGKDGFDDKFKPYVSTEFDVTGNILYDYEEEQKNARAGKRVKTPPVAPLARPSDTVKSVFKKLLLKPDSLSRSNPKSK
jgi:hypothetical protein